MKRWKYLIFLIIGLGAYSLNVLNRYPPHLTPIIAKYQGKSDKEKLKIFQKNFAYALKKTSRMEWIGKVYTDGLMNHISYTEWGPSFASYIELHQYLNCLSEKFHREKRFASVYIGTADFFRDYDAAFKSFLTEFKELELIDDLEAYEIRLNVIYKDFLVKFIHDHHVYLRKRLRGNLERLEKTGFQKLDMLDRAVFALQKEWSSYEWNEQKYQFEQLYVSRSDDGQLLIVGYNDRDYACDKLLHVYTWDLKTENSKPVHIKYKDMAFDLSPVPRTAGCSFGINFIEHPEVVSFDGRYLKFYGHDVSIYRHYTYDLKMNQWDVQEKLSQP